MRQAQLIYQAGGKPQSFPFVDQIEIGRSRSGEQAGAGRIVFPDPRISSRHCIVSQSPDGRFYVRDLSRNGTRVDGKRLIPNIEFEVKPGQTIMVGSVQLELWAAEEGTIVPQSLGESTILASGLSFVTILVGDIRGYTTLSQRADSGMVSQSVRAVFSELEEMIPQHGGSVKEYQGDAIFAFWEEDPDSPTRHAVQACTAALALADRVSRLARNPNVWKFTDHPLHIDWALTTGGVVISSFGKDRPTGLSMVGDVVNLAFRIEKLANDETGSILACSNTRQLAGTVFEFTDLGEHTVRGREGAERVHALVGRMGS